MKLNIIGDFFGASGYASHTRQLANALFDEGLEISIDCPRPQGWEALITDNERTMLNTPFDLTSNILMISLPHTWDIILSEKPKNFYGYLVWEGDRIPDSFIKQIMDERVTGIIVPSKHTYDAIKEVVLPLFMDKIHIFHHGVNLDLFRPQEKRDSDFVFICNKGWAQGSNDRGGVQYLIKAFNEEFRPEEPVKLIIKINPTYNNPAWNLQNEIGKLGLTNLNPKIFFNTDLVEYNHLPILYAGDCYVAPVMADAFNLPVLEAMASELPVITTNFGGQAELVDGSNGLLVSGKMKEIKWDIMYEGISWLEPDISELRKAMRYAVEHKEEFKMKGINSLEKSKEFTWKNTAKKLISLFNKDN